MPAFCARLVDLEQLHEDVSCLRRRSAEAEDNFRSDGEVLRRCQAHHADAQRRLQQAMHQVSLSMPAVTSAAGQANMLEQTASSREEALMALLDSTELCTGSAREAAVLELQELERHRRDAETVLQPLREAEAAAAVRESRLRARVHDQRSMVKELHAAREAAEARLSSLKAAEASAVKAEVVPYVDLKAPVSSWRDMNGALLVSLVVAAGQHVWPVHEVLDTARMALEGQDNRALLEVDGVLQLVILNQSTASLILSKPQPPLVTPLEVLRDVLGEFRTFRVSPKVLEAVHGASGIHGRREVSVPLSFRGILRNYQLQGFRWLVSNHANGFGCLLADDMGLGKTIQTVCLLCYLQEQHLLTGPALVVVPASLLQNWKRELSRWAPTLRTCEYIGSGRRWLSAADVILTTYGIVLHDARRQRGIGRLGALVLDEAQRVKNHSAGISQACKHIAANCTGFKIALSGTPVENRIEEIHSILEVVLPCYLGKLQEFKRSFVPSKEKVDTAKLRRVIDPFMLRRLKTDPAVCPELPPKVDMQHDVALTAKQESLYRAVHEHFMTAIAGADGKMSRGRHILSMIHALRKVCNHPATYDGPSGGFSEKIARTPDESGKTRCFLELLRGILQQGEKCLVFVQYLNTIELLRTFVREILGLETEAYTGSLDAQQRPKVVDKFQNDAACKVMFATLGAGGVGLNLTAASHVVHFDRCYNPAVEDQGSDRAHRIGQKSTVMVHRLITQGTFEERIDAIMKEKQHLREAFSDGDAMTSLTDYSDRGLRDLFGLRSGQTVQRRGTSGSLDAEGPAALARQADPPQVPQFERQPSLQEPAWSEAEAADNAPLSSNKDQSSTLVNDLKRALPEAPTPLRSSNLLARLAKRGYDMSAMKHMLTRTGASSSVDAPHLPEKHAKATASSDIAGLAGKTAGKLLQGSGLGGFFPLMRGESCKTDADPGQVLDAQKRRRLCPSSLDDAASGLESQAVLRASSPASLNPSRATADQMPPRAACSSMLGPSSSHALRELAVLSRESTSTLVDVSSDEESC